MEFFEQSLNDILARLSPLHVEWQDEISRRVIDKISTIPVKPQYTEGDIVALLASGFTEGLIVCQLFLGISRDALSTELDIALGSGGRGIQRFEADRNAFVKALVEIGLLEAMATEVNRKPVWSDLLVERLRMGRGRAISGQRRGRGLEDFVESVIQKVFGSQYDTRCQFVGARKLVAKCDFAIPGRELPRIVVEAKGYGATGSKMSDIIGDLDTIIREKRHDTTLIFITDGLTWNQRKSDLRKIVERQNRGEITRVYTSLMADKLEEDLRTLKQEYRI